MNCNRCGTASNQMFCKLDSRWLCAVCWDAENPSIPVGSIPPSPNVEQTLLDWCSGAIEVEAFEKLNYLQMLARFRDAARDRDDMGGSVLDRYTRHLRNRPNCGVPEVHSVGVES